MENKGELANNWKKDIWKSIDEQDVTDLRNKLNEIQSINKNKLQSYNMNSSEGAESME